MHRLLAPFLLGLFGLAGVVMTLSEAGAQGPPATSDAQTTFDDTFDSLPSFAAPAGGAVFGPKVEFSGSYQVEEGGREGTLSIQAVLQPSWHLYSTTQPAGGPRPTEISVVDSPDFQVMGDFSADRDPKIESDPVFPGVRIEWFSNEVTWTAPILLAEDVQADSLQIQVIVNGQVCETGGACELVSGEQVTASFAGYTPAEKLSDAFQDPDGHIKITGYLEPGVAAPGGTVQLVLTAQLDGQWHVYHYEPTDPKRFAKPTLIALRKTAGWPYGDVVASEKPKQQESGIEEEPIMYYHEGAVSWRVPITVPREAQPGEYEIAGGIGFQTCTPSTCDMPMAADFQGKVTVGKAAGKGRAALTFTASKYEKIAREAAAIAEARKASLKEVPARGGTWSEKSVLTVLGLAFLAGLILNVMPCVLPVIGLKVMSFVQQAGGSRREILALNLWFSLGLMSVFWFLAATAVSARLANQSWGWADHFGELAFLVPMIGIVFAFGLSFLGVWEIPIPGFVGSSTVQGVAQKEGAVGAFSKGVLSTILATPCAGPLLVPAVGWATAQPPWLTVLTLNCIGLGMAAPYLLIGVAPRLINFLPRPGAWMDTFKQLMGFLLMGTVVFLFVSVPERHVIPTLTLLLGIGIACWWIGRTPMTADLTTKVKGWAISLLMIAAAAVVGFVFLLPHQLIDWQPYSRVSLDQHLKEGRTVMVDFTADW